MKATGLLSSLCAVQEPLMLIHDLIPHWRATTNYHTLVSVSCTSANDDCSFVVGCDAPSAAVQDVMEDSLAQAASRREL